MSALHLTVTPRDFLASLTPPQAKAGTRGRFSAEATATLAKARADGYLFLGDEGNSHNPVAEVKAPTVKPAKAVSLVKAAPVEPSEGSKVRAWARDNGIAVGDRGRFAPSLLAAYAAQDASLFTVKAPVVKVAKAPKAVEVKVQPVQAQVNAKDVRAWAKGNGHEVAERGRVHASVIAAYLAAGGRPATPSAPRPTAVVLPKVRAANSGFTTVGGILIRQDTCGHCAASVSRCACTEGPRARGFLERENGGPLLLTLDKPVV